MSNTTTVAGLEGVPDVIRRYFALDADREIDSIVALFSDGATVVDEGETREGTTAIRAWQTGPASQYTYTTDVLGAAAVTADRFVVTGRLTGNFPGGTAELKWDFTVAGDRISRLARIVHETAAAPMVGAALLSARAGILRGVEARRIYSGGSP